MIRKLSLPILVILLIAVAFWILSWIIDGYFYSPGHGVLGVLMLIGFIAVVIIGIIQLVYAAQEKNGLGIAAGICSILIFVPFMWIAILVLQVMIYFKLVNSK